MMRNVLHILKHKFKHTVSSFYFFFPQWKDLIWKSKCLSCLKSLDIEKNPPKFKTFISAE